MRTLKHASTDVVFQRADRAGLLREVLRIHPSLHTCATVIVWQERRLPGKHFAARRGS